MAHTHKIKNGIKIELTADEISVLENQDIEWNSSAFDRAIENLRKKRNNLLAETDWWGASDNTMSAEQTKYRQDLRDITNGLATVEEVNEVEFPTKPS